MADLRTLARRGSQESKSQARRKETAQSDRDRPTPWEGLSNTAYFGADAPHKTSSWHLGLDLYEKGWIPASEVALSPNAAPHRTSEDTKSPNETSLAQILGERPPKSAMLP